MVETSGLQRASQAAKIKGSIGVMEYWSIGFKTITPTLQYSITPVGRL
jgi:hypothetical protein